MVSADLTGAILDHASIDRADCRRLRAVGASFLSASLRRSAFEDSDFTGALDDGARWTDSTGIDQKAGSMRTGKTRRFGLVLDLLVGPGGGSRRPDRQRQQLAARILHVARAEAAAIGDAPGDTLELFVDEVARRDGTVDQRLRTLALEDARRQAAPPAGPRRRAVR